jgi:hypothetical protein
VRTGAAPGRPGPHCRRAFESIGVPVRSPGGVVANDGLTVRDRPGARVEEHAAPSQWIPQARSEAAYVAGDADQRLVRSRCPLHDLAVAAVCSQGAHCWPNLKLRIRCGKAAAKQASSLLSADPLPRILP